MSSTLRSINSALFKGTFEVCEVVRRPRVPAYLRFGNRLEGRATSIGGHPRTSLVSQQPEIISKTSRYGYVHSLLAVHYLECTTFLNVGRRNSDPVEVHHVFDWVSATRYLNCK